MKRRVLMKLICITIVSAMLISNTAVLMAGDGVRTVIYNEQQMTVTVSGDVVILPDGQQIPLAEFTGQFIDDPAPAPAPEPQQPAQPEVPETPQSPGEGQEPVTPSQPETPQNPGEEEQKPVTPGQPETPQNPGDEEQKPVTPGQPETPQDPGDEEQKPVTPGQPETPQDPGDEEQKPVTPGQPETPQDPGDEEQKPVTPGQPETPQSPDDNAQKPNQPGRPEPQSSQPELWNTASTGTGFQENSFGADMFGMSRSRVDRDSLLIPSISQGSGFFIEELKEKYRITFSDDFKEIMESIEKEAVLAAVSKDDGQAETEAEKTEEKEEPIDKEAVAVVFTKLLEDKTEEARVFSALEGQELKVLNWQDVLAVYLLNQKRAGVTDFVLDESSKEGLAEIFAQMNTVTVTEDEVTFTPQYLEEYIGQNGSAVTSEEQRFLNTYTSANCMVLCAAATNEAGFILKSLGEDVSEERARVVAAAYSLVGKVDYFWGGKSSVIGWDPRWGSPTQVTAAGSRSSGTVRNYGLDCSGFVTWAFINGYENKAAEALIGHGTTAQWGMTEAVSEEEALPGDLVFLRGPSAVGADNHIGIVVGRDDDGSLITVHCSSSKGVNVQSAYEVGFRYIRRPLAYS